MEAAAKTIRVRDIMTTEVITVVAGTSIDDAARSLTFHRVSGAPVLDHGRIVGVVSKSDLMDPRNRPTGEGRGEVREVMTRVVRAVRPGDPAMQAVRLMADEAVHRAVVVDDQGKLVGIVSPMDVLRALARGDFLQRGDPTYLDRQEQHAEPAHYESEPSTFAFVDLTNLPAA